MLATAIHRIHRRVDGELRVEQPLSVFECASEAEFNELEALGAVRESSESEVALFERHTNRRPASAPARAPTPETAAEKKARTAAEKKAEDDVAAQVVADAQAADDAARLAAGEILE